MPLINPNEIDKAISEYLSSGQLYSKIKIDMLFLGADIFSGKAFSFFCEKEKETRTFKLEPYPSSVSPLVELNDKLKRYERGDKTISITQHYRGLCQHCRKFHVDIILNSFTTEPRSSSTIPTVYLSKIGQYPPVEIAPEKYVFKYLNDEDKGNYKKGLMLLSQSYGIGAFAYFRRIVENEILRIINDLAKLDFVGAAEIRKLMDKYSSNHQMATLIEAIFEYLPSSLKTLGNNPLKVLHNQLSAGLHSYSEEECFEKAKSIDNILKFVIKRLNEEQSEVMVAKEAMKKLSEKK